eukprot:scaffold12183_cov112-Isochrysis_galbana.AAC.2
MPFVACRALPLPPPPRRHHSRVPLRDQPHQVPSARIAASPMPASKTTSAPAAPTSPAPPHTTATASLPTPSPTTPSPSSFFDQLDLEARRHRPTSSTAPGAPSSTPRAAPRPTSTSATPPSPTASPPTSMTYASGSAKKSLPLISDSPCGR